MERSSRCTSFKKDGTDCGSRPMRGTNHCFFHHPALREERLAASANGGRARRPAPIVLPVGTPMPDLTSIGGSGELARQLIPLVLTGQLDPQIVYPVTSLMTIVQRSHILALEERLAKLEAELTRILAHLGHAR